MAAFGTKRVRAGVTLATPTLGKLYDDAILTPGSLLLLDTGHSTRPMFTADTAASKTIPATGTKLANIADTLLPALGITSTTGCTFDYTAEYATTGTVTGKSERSAKGGLHVISAQGSNAAGGNRFAAVRIDPAIVAYLVANPSHAYYVSVWRRVTRETPTAQVGGIAWSGMASTQPITAGPTLWALYQSFNTNVGGDAPTSTSGQRLGETRVDPTSAASYLGPSFAAVATQGWQIPASTTVAAPTGSNDNGGRAIAQWGAASPFSQNQGSKVPSWVFYRAYVEDLTFSGRTYATVSALDLPRFNNDVVGSGKFSGDTTPTNPTSIP